MAWIYSPDGVTVERRLRNRPNRHWVQESTDPPVGRYEPINSDAEANSFGYYELVIDPQPDQDHIRDGDGALDGTVWRVTWIFDQATADANAAEAAEEAERDAVRALLPNLITQRDQIDTVQANIDTVTSNLPGSNDQTRRQLIADLAAEVRELAQGQRLAMRSLIQLVRDL